MNVATQIARWHRYWRTATSAQDVERQLKRLYWLQEFTFVAGPSIRAEQVAALHQQIELGEKKLAELNGDFACPLESLPKAQAEQPDWVTR